MMIVPDPVLVHPIRGVIDSEIPLVARAAAEVDLSTAHDSVPADVRIRLDHDDRGPMLEGGHCAGEARRSGPRRDEVGFVIPQHLIVGAAAIHSCQRDGTHSGGRASLEEISALQARTRLLRCAHRSFSGIYWSLVTRSAVSPARSARKLQRGPARRDPATICG